MWAGSHFFLQDLSGNFIVLSLWQPAETNTYVHILIGQFYELTISWDLRFLKMKASSIPLTWLRTRKDNLLKYLQGRLASVEKVCYSKWLNLNTLAIHGYEILRVSELWGKVPTVLREPLTIWVHFQHFVILRERLPSQLQEKKNTNKNENNQLISFKFLER